MYHRVTAIGKLAIDPKVFELEDGRKVAKLVLAINNRKQGIIWIDARAVGKLAEFCGAYLKKADCVFIEGCLIADENGRPRVYTDKNGVQRADYKISIRILKLVR